MSMQLFKHKFSNYLEHFPQTLYFRVQYIQHQFLFNKEFFYFGTSIGQMRHGIYGICFKVDNSNGNLLVYEGSWEKDQYNGKGSLFLISAPKPNTNQTFRWSQGFWKNGRLNGKGQIKQFNHQSKQWEIIYKGNFQENHKNGYGVQYFEGNRYQGQFENGCRQGKGRLIESTGNFYDGNFQLGFPCGQGFQLKGGILCIKDKDGNQIVYDRPQKHDLSSFLTKTIKNI